MTLPFLPRLLLPLLLTTSSPAANSTYSLHFGGGGSLTVEGTNFASGARAFSVEFRFKLTGKVRQSTPIVSRWQDRRDAEDPGSFFVELRAPRGLAFGIRDAENRTALVIARPPWEIGTWHHVLCTWTGRELVIAFDGKELERQTTEDFTGLATSSLPLRIGPWNEPGTRRPVAFEGFLADLALWNVARSLEDGPLVGTEPELALQHSLAVALPAKALENATGEGMLVLTEALARGGWAHTVRPDDEAPRRPSLDLFCQDLVTAGVDPGERAILVHDEEKERIGVLWQGQDGRIWITWVPGDLSEPPVTIALDELGTMPLAAGTADPDGHVYALQIEAADRSRAEGQPLEAKLSRCHPDGELELSRPIDTSEGAFNVWSYTNRFGGGGNLRYSQGHLGLLLPRTMYRSRDGLNHQGCIAVLFDATRLEVERMLGTTSSHSIDNVLFDDDKGTFLALDLGDNYPRGVHLHRFSRRGKDSAVVFTYKTAHGTQPRNGSPRYDEISGEGQTFYKWSNDNAVYTELGGLIEGRRAILVVFATDRSLEGKVLDNSRAFRGCDDPRDLVVMRIAKNFEKAGRGNEVPDAILAGRPKETTVETGGFFDFNGNWSKQRITGVEWLTNHGRGEAAHSPMLLPLEDRRALVLWEHEDGTGRSLRALSLDETGEKLGEPMRVDLELDLVDPDRVVRVEDRLFLLARDRRDSRLRLYSILDA